LIDEDIIASIKELSDTTEYKFLLSMTNTSY